MRFHALMCVRDEDDILPQCLEHLLTWADAIYLLDTGSTDATWDIVHHYAHLDQRVIPFRRQPMVFENYLRGWLFENYRHRMDPGDWIIRADADEFYELLTPPQFVQQCLASYESRVELVWYLFRLTRQDVTAWDAGRESILDRHKPIQQRRHWFMIPRGTEWRMIRYRRSLRWHHTMAQPYSAGYVARALIPVCHYPHRDPLQMDKRMALRSFVSQFRQRANHWKQPDWRREIVDVSWNPQRNAYQARFDDAEVTGRTNKISDMTIYRRPPDSHFPPITTRHHLESWPRRLLKLAAYSSLITLLDRRHPGFSPTFQPMPLPEKPILQEQSHKPSPNNTSIPSPPPMFTLGNAKS